VPLKALVRAALGAEGCVAGDIGVVLADDTLLRSLNRRYRGKDRATDVLSFEYVTEGANARDRARAPRIHGDLAVSLERVEEQARRFRVTRGRELARLVIHGALHLTGHDHHHAGERRVMRTAEQRVMRASAPAIAKLDRAFGPRRAGR